MFLNLLLNRPIFPLSPYDCYLVSLTLTLSFSLAKEETNPPFFLSLPLLPLGPGVFLEVNEKRNLNCLPLKGMSGSAGWKLVLLMSLTFSMWAGHLWLQVCVRSVLCTAQECCGLGDSRGRRVGYQAGLRIQERRGVRGIFGIFQEPFQSGSRCILLPRDLAEQPDRQWSREERKGERHALLPICLMMLVVEDGTELYIPRCDGTKKPKSRQDRW